MIRAECLACSHSPGPELAYKPHNTTYVVIGTVFLWFGWFGFNGGSALSANLRAASASIVTNLAASVGGLTWMFWGTSRPSRDFLRFLDLVQITELNASGRPLDSVPVLLPVW